MNITVCAKCGSQDIERLAWVTLRSKQMTEFLDAGDMPTVKTNWCNNCGDRCDVLELDYLEKYGSAYRITGGNDPSLVYYPMFKDGSVQMDEIEVEIDNAFDEKERRIFFEDMLALFPDNKTEVMYIFKPYIDTVKEFVTEQVENAIELIFYKAHREFNTHSGDIEPMQDLRLDRIKQDLVDLVTTQVKQNL